MARTNGRAAFPQNTDPEKEKQSESEREEQAAKLKLWRTKLKHVQRKLRGKQTTESETKKDGRRRTEPKAEPSRNQKYQSSE